MTIAVYLLGGASRPIDTEDVAIKANELAPGRFTWRKYPGQINIETVRKRLWDAARTGGLGYLTGTERTGWSLTPKGLQFAEGAATAGGLPDYSKNRLSLQDKHWRSAERQRLLGTEAYLVSQRDGIDAVTSRQAAALFRLDEYVVGHLRDRKIERLLNAFADDPELGPILVALSAKARSTKIQ